MFKIVDGKTFKKLREQIELKIVKESVFISEALTMLDEYGISTLSNGKVMRFRGWSKDDFVQIDNNELWKYGELDSEKYFPTIDELKGKWDVLKKW